MPLPWQIGRMEENALLIVTGAVWGVLAALFLVVLCKLWGLTVPPLLRRWWYRGVNISGEWKGLGTRPAAAAGEWSEVTVHLKQQAGEVHGLLTLRSRASGQSFDLNLRFAGRIARGYVTLNLSPVSRRIASAATALLKIEAAGALNGQLLYRNPFADHVEVINVSVHQAESVATPRLNPVLRQDPHIEARQGAAPLAALAGD